MTLQRQFTPEAQSLLHQATRVTLELENGKLLEAYKLASQSSTNEQCMASERYYILEKQKARNMSEDKDGNIKTSTEREQIGAKLIYEQAVSANESQETKHREYKTDLRQIISSWLGWQKDQVCFTTSCDNTGNKKRVLVVRSEEGPQETFLFPNANTAQPA